jgi:hypothetical protein
MADNVTLNPGTGGATIATDDDGTAQHQYVKVEFGADGTFTKVTSSVGLPVKEIKSATPTQSSVADSASSVTILASNANRLGATIHNDSSAVLYLKLGATASTTSYTAYMIQHAYYEVPFGYTGVIDGIWASDPGDGAARVTEFT